jgi:menaquinone-dependent protoporphyrinogen oxidase
MQMAQLLRSRWAAMSRSSKIAVIYASTEGQSAKIASHIAGTLSAAHQVESVNVAELPEGFSLGSYDGVVVGGSIHAGKVQSELRDFVRTHRDELETRMSAFYLVCLTAASQAPDTRAKLSSLVDTFVEDTGWKPAHLGVFAGALKYSQYGWVKRQLMRFIASRQGGDTDASHDYEYTQWDSVTHFAADFSAAIDPRTQRSAENDTAARLA